MSRDVEITKKQEELAIFSRRYRDAKVALMEFDEERSKRSEEHAHAQALWKKCVAELLQLIETPEQKSRLDIEPRSS